MAELIRSSEAWDAGHDANGKELNLVTPSLEQQVVTLNTAGKYVDKNIKIAVAPVDKNTAISKVGDSTLTVDTTQSGMTDGISSTATSYYATGTARTTEGYTAGESKTDSTPIYLKEATCAVTGGVVSATATSGTASTSVTGMKTTTTNTGYSVHAEATGGNASASITDVKDTHTAGYLPSKSATTVISGNSKNETGKRADEIKYIVKSQIGVSAIDGETYTPNTSIVVPSEGTLYISEGYTPGISISLDQMLGGNPSNEAIFGEDKLEEGAIAYDLNGKKITGTMKTATLSAGVTLNGAIGGNGISTSGITTTKPSSGAYVTITGKGSANVNQTGRVIKPKSAVESGETTKYLPITVSDPEAMIGAATVSGTGSKQASAPTIKTATGGTITPSALSTTKPSSGTYIAIQATAPATTGIQVTQTNATSGYTNLAAGASIGTASTTEKNGSIYYATINPASMPAGSVSCAISNGNSASMTISTPTVVNNSYDNTSKTVKLSTSGSTKLTVNHTITKTAGYIEAGTTAGTSKEITVSSTPAQFDFPAYDGSYSIV